MADFSLHRKDINEISIISIEGYLDSNTAPSMEDAIKKLVEENRYKIVVNFEKLLYINSAGLGIFWAYFEDIRAKNGDIKMCNMADKVFKIFDLLGFSSVYDIVKEESEAISKFEKS